jgi:hypothetical protein
MAEHPALLSRVPLGRTFLVRTPKQWNVVATFGEALHMLCGLPRELDGIHWALASTSLCFAARDPTAGAAPQPALLLTRLRRTVYCAGTGPAGPDLRTRTGLLARRCSWMLTGKCL